MKNRLFEKVLSAFLAVAIMFASVPMAAFAEGEETEGTQQEITQTTDTQQTESQPADTPGDEPSNNVTPTDETQTQQPAPVVCGKCGAEGHEADVCPVAEVVPNDKVYISNYEVVDSKGRALSKVNPGDNVIIAISVIDERIEAGEFGVPSGSSTSRIHVNMAQGAFSVPSSSVIDVKMRNPVDVRDAMGNSYQAICYTIAFRGVTYLGGTPDFSFGISYTGENGTNTDNNMPLPYPYSTLNINVSQATDDIPAPTVILNNANYGKVATVGVPFALSTVATNTSTNLDLDNVSVKIVLPNGIILTNGNSQVLIGSVGKGGTISHDFSLIAEGVANDVTSLPVQLIYTYEAFVGGKRTQFTSQHDISINVQQPTRFDIQSMYNEEMMYMGNESYMSVSLVNKGKTTVYNVTAELVSDTLTAYEVEFLGNIMPGSTGDAEFDFTASQAGTSTGKVVITYEDASGTVYTFEKEFTIEVMEEMAWDEPVFNEPVVMPVEEKTNYWPFIIGGVVVVGAVAFAVIKKKKKAKRQAELEDEDEDI